MSHFIVADIPIPTEAIIAILVVAGQLVAWFQAKRQQEGEDESAITDDDREIIWERQTSQNPEAPVEVELPQGNLREVNLREILTPRRPAAETTPEPARLKIATPVAPPALPARPVEIATPTPPPPRSLGSSARSRLLASLASPSAARDAIVINEVLGPPRGM